MDKPITDIIKQYLFENGITVSHLANSLKVAQPNLTRTLKKNDISVMLLYRISEILKHDFFQYLKPLEKRNEIKTSTAVTDNLNYLLNENLELYRKLEKERSDKEALTKSSKAVPSKSKQLKSK